MAVLEPRLALLDETDSGLDIDALRIVSDGVNRLRNEDNAMVLVTHYQRMLNYVPPRPGTRAGGRADCAVRGAGTGFGAGGERV